MIEGNVVVVFWSWLKVRVVKEFWGKKIVVYNGLGENGLWVVGLDMDVGK